MTISRTKVEKMVDQVSNHKVPKEEDEVEVQFISTGSTLLDLAISGGIVDGGGVPGGLLLELFGPSGSGKTAVLCELAGDIQRQGGTVLFRDPEGRLDTQFANMFGFSIAMESDNYTQPDTVTEFFEGIDEWKPEPPNIIHGICGDSLAALSTELEMEKGDKMGMRRAKEFSEQLRKVCRYIKQHNILMACSNQVRINTDTGGYTTPGGKAVEFYSSLRLYFKKSEKIVREIRPKLGTESLTQKRVIGIQTTVEVYKSSIDKPHRTAPVCIVFDYGIDDIRANLQYIKDMTGATTYTLDGTKETSMGVGIDQAIRKVEASKLVRKLKQNVIDIWEKIEAETTYERVKKIR